MDSLIDEAKEIIEMSLNAQTDSEAYSSKANDWLKRAKAHEVSEASHSHSAGTSCALCGNDLICPSCDED